MRIIVDTNVVIAAARSSEGASAAVMEMVIKKEVDLLLSVTLILEYEDVLKREQTNLSPDEIMELIAYLSSNSIRQEPMTPHWPLLDDPGDEFLARLVLSCDCDHLVTHNIRHFRELQDRGISVVTPADLLSIMRRAR